MVGKNSQTLRHSAGAKKASKKRKLTSTNSMLAIPFADGPNIQHKQ
jgi:hypothetical protein